jgi:hypothetical protein
MHRHYCPTCSRKTKTCYIEGCKLAPFVCPSCAGAPPSLFATVRDKLGLTPIRTKRDAPPVESGTLDHVDDPDWEGGEPWRHPLDPLAHKRLPKPKPSRFWHGFGSWVRDNTGLARLDDRPTQDPERFERPNLPPWWQGRR